MYSLFLLFCVICIVLSPFAANAFLTAIERRALRRYHHNTVTAEEAKDLARPSSAFIPAP